MNCTAKNTTCETIDPAKVSCDDILNWIASSEDKSDTVAQWLDALCDADVLAKISEDFDRPLISEGDEDEGMIDAVGAAYDILNGLDHEAPAVDAIADYRN